MSKQELPQSISPVAMSKEQLADLLTKAGGRKITPAMIGNDIVAGAPTNGDGSLNLIQYAAWLAAASMD